MDINTNIDEGENIHQSGGIVLKFAVREKQWPLKRDESGGIVSFNHHSPTTNHIVWVSLLEPICLFS